MKVLDLFCGMGGWSKPWIESGHDVTGIDIMDYNYPGKFIQADLLNWEPDQYYDMVFASPPCTEFSIAKKYAWGNQDERIGLDLVYRAFYIISKIKPKWFVIENVKGLADFIDKPNQIVRYGKNSNHKAAYLWTNIPQIGMLDSTINLRCDDYGNSSPKRSEIPRPLSQAVYNTIDR